MSPVRRVVLGVVILTAVSAAQARGQEPSPPPASRREPFGIGAVLRLGAEPITPPLTAAMVRLSLPAGARVGLDLDAGWAGRSSGNPAIKGRTLGAEFRFLVRERAGDGATGYVIAGPFYASARNRTIIRYPGGTVVVEQDRPIRTIQAGYGWDWWSRRGVRSGIEITKGGLEGPVILVQGFVVWSPRRR